MYLSQYLRYNIDPNGNTRHAAYLYRVSDDVGWVSGVGKYATVIDAVAGNSTEVEGVVKSWAAEYKAIELQRFDIDYDEWQVANRNHARHRAPFLVRSTSRGAEDDPAARFVWAGAWTIGGAQRIARNHHNRDELLEIVRRSEPNVSLSYYRRGGSVKIEDPQPLETT